MTPEIKKSYEIKKTKSRKDESREKNLPTP
jgi:hypothetical protein